MAILEWTRGRILGRTRHVQTLLLQGIPKQRAGGWSSYDIISVSAKVLGVRLVHPESYRYRPASPLPIPSLFHSGYRCFHSAHSPAWPRSGAGTAQNRP